MTCSYPSLVESSDADGGSSVAVLTYLKCIVESTDHPDLLDIMLRYLLAIPERIETVTKPTRPTTLARRRKSSMLMTNLAQGQEKPMPDLFTLVDLILTSLRSRDAQTVTATLKLVSIILRYHHQYAMSSIVKTRSVPNELFKRTLDTHQKDVDALLAMAEDLIEHDGLTEAYASHLQDARIVLETHCCSSRLLALPAGGAQDAVQPPNPSEEVAVVPHAVRTDDNLLGSLNALLEDFLGNDIDTNLSLTGAYASLVSCGNTCLSGWFLSGDVDSNSHINSLQAQTELDARGGNSPKDDSIETIPSLNDQHIEQPRERHTGIGSPQSPVFAIFERLVRRVESLRRGIRDLDTYLEERRHLLYGGADTDQAVAVDPAHPSQPGDQGTAGFGKTPTSQGRGVGPSGLTMDRLMYDTQSSNDSRSSSPRGRKPGDQSHQAIVDRLNHLRISPSPRPSKAASRTSPSPQPNNTFTSQSKDLSREVPDVLQQKVKVKNHHSPHEPPSKTVGESETSETSSIRSETTAQAQSIDPKTEVPLGQLLTNIIILQEFILELAAIVEVRASLFNDVTFV